MEDDVIIYTNAESLSIRPTATYSEISINIILAMLFRSLGVKIITVTS